MTISLELSMHIFSNYKIYIFEQLSTVKEQILVEKVRAIQTASDKNDEHDYLQPLKQFLQKGL